MDDTFNYKLYFNELFFKNYSTDYFPPFTHSTNGMSEIVSYNKFNRSFDKYMLEWLKRNTSFQKSVLVFFVAIVNWFFSLYYYFLFLGGYVLKNQRSATDRDLLAGDIDLDYYVVYLLNLFLNISINTPPAKVND